MAASTSTMAKISQLSCFSSMNHQFHLQRRSFLCPMVRPEPFVVMSLDGHVSETASSDSRTSLSYAAEASKPFTEEVAKSYPTAEESATGETEIKELVEEHAVTREKKAAKIHDFCFGIPYGGLILSGGVLGFVFSRNLTTLSTDVLCGGALLALSTFSLKIWRQGKSSFPFILGQAVVAAFLFWKNFEAYSLTKRLIPTGFYAAISAAMLCFYSYVVLSGGNPPPKKLKVSASPSS